MKQHIATSNGIYEQIKDQILHLELPPGASISEIDTAEKYNVSRTPVRDAFKRLEREGLLEIRPHIGTFISLIDLNAISDILYIREAIEYSVLTDLSQIYDQSLSLRIQLILQEQKELLESDLPIEELSRAFIRSDNEFHATLFDSAGKKNIFTSLHSYYLQYERLRTFINLTGKDALQKLYDSHIEIWNCVINKDLTRLKECINYHLYDGVSTSPENIYKSPEYFTKIHS